MTLPQKTLLQEDLDNFITQNQKPHPLTLESLPSEIFNYFHSTNILLSGTECASCPSCPSYQENLISDLSLLTSITRLDANEITPTLRDWAVYSTLSLSSKGYFFHAPIEKLICAILDKIDEELSHRIWDIEIELNNQEKGPFSPEHWAWTLEWLRHVRLGDEILEFVRLIRDEVEDKYAAGVVIEARNWEGDEKSEAERGEHDDAMSVLTIGWDQMRGSTR